VKFLKWKIFWSLFMIDIFFYKTILTAFFVGLECGILGVFIFLLNIPFVGVAIAHSAMAGGIWGVVLNIPSKISAFLLSVVSALFIGPLTDKSKSDPNITVSIIFSAVMGLAFLGVGLLKGKNELVLNFLWGNILLVDFFDFILILCGLILEILIIMFFYKQYFAILFSREIATSLGINDKFFYYLIFFLIGIIITVNLDIIGGLMLFSLIITPAAIAYQITFDLKKFFLYSGFFGGICAVLGVALSFMFNLPASATVVLFTTFLYIIFLIFSPKRKKYG